ncbi:MAG: hypothetical protein B7Y77_02425 [Bradyrhizobium sp. 35-63-5]|nr:MAG: hypothetical protein B7Y77_02425 [Bradyrhizobium sp. 35-63-5]
MVHGGEDVAPVFAHAGFRRGPDVQPVLATLVIDLGPEGGDAGGRLVFAGPPDELAACATSFTGQALARAIVIEPRVLLCDEPLGALDKKLRQSMQFELKQLQKTLGVTLVFVTHDQEEALAMSDRIAVLNAGKVEQVGTPVEIYDRPATRFVADFIGDTNLFRGDISRTADGESVLTVAPDLSLPLPLPLPAMPGASGPLSVALRPEKIRLSAGMSADACATGQVESTNFQGGFVLYRVALAGDRHVLAQQSNTGSGQTFAPGDAVSLAWGPADLVILRD